MSHSQQPGAIVVGAGIVGLALARALAEAGYKVTVFDRHERAVGASVRNFGTVWPIGVPNGPLYDRALRSRSIWRQFCDETGTWSAPSGSLVAAWHDDEWQVMNEYAEANAGLRPCRAIDAREALRHAPGLVSKGLLGALLSDDELVVDPREAIRAMPAWLSARYGVTFHWRQAVTRVEHPWVWSGGRRYAADVIYVAGGSDFETLFPELYDRQAITKCKLQMLRLEAQPSSFRLGPVVCGGLTMAHYSGFHGLPGIERLRSRLAVDYADLTALGIHVMAAQNGLGEITGGDSHEYGHTLDPFDETSINGRIVDYLRGVLDLPHWNVKQTWHGTYAKLTEPGRSELVLEAEPGVTIVNGVGGGGLGMTLSFGLAEDIVSGRLQPQRDAVALAATG
ncbi:TIGR03364 family FAD-dependent oxidoreductase [Rothia nasimurium]|uniref:TIGR03364 family FAD-dependent oxidoreductase n=1 Tax=Luteibacter anthropi TaxID=564369 RepID=A0A7X5UBV7_9GAMM|nr:TIGR03364 family FAD-dependent oxidoreductase [Luteibacter anthropi]NII07479.1 TIGR03364 family FAD-dependent oxidoreductase [Luteibacter anthropi]